MLPSEPSIVDLFRFTLLLTGDLKIAETVLLETLQDGSAQVEQFRNQKHCCAWIVATLRERSKQLPTPMETASAEIQSEPANDEVLQLAKSFSQMVEPERSALALFYLDLFSPDEIANLLHLKHEELAKTLTKARESLTGTVMFSGKSSSSS